MRNFKNHFSNNLNNKKDMLNFVTIVVLILPFAFVVIIKLVKNNDKHKLRQLQAELASKALEKGESIPTDLFVEPKTKNNPLNTGIIFIATGIGFSLFLWLFSTFVSELNKDMSAAFMAFASVGILPFMVGIAFVIIHFIEKKQ